MCSLNQTNGNIINDLFSLFTTCVMYFYPVQDSEPRENQCKKFPPAIHLFQLRISIEVPSQGYRLINKYSIINKNRRLWLRMCSEPGKRTSSSKLTNCLNGHFICPTQCLNILVHGHLSTYCLVLHYFMLFCYPPSSCVHLALQHLCYMLTH